MEINKETELLISLFVENENYQELTKKAYKGTLYKFFTFIPLKQFKGLYSLEMAIETILECFDGAKDKTLNEIFNRIRTFMNSLTSPLHWDCHKLKYIFNDTTYVKSLSEKDIDIIKSFLLQFDKRILATFLLINNLPLRREEITQISPADFTGDKPSIVIFGKNNKKRDIFVISKEVIDFIKLHNIQNFVSPRILYDKMKEAEIYLHELTGSKNTLINFNIMRHTFITRMIDNGFSIIRLSKLSGHGVTTLYENYYANNFTKSKNEYEDIVNIKINYKTDKLYIKYLEEVIREQFKMLKSKK